MDTRGRTDRDGGNGGRGTPAGLDDILFPAALIGGLYELGKTRTVAPKNPAIIPLDIPQVQEIPGGLNVGSPTIETAGEFVESNITALIGEPILGTDYLPPSHGTLLGTVTLNDTDTFSYTRSGGAGSSGWSLLNNGQPLVAGVPYPFSFHVHPGDAVNFRAGAAGGSGSVTIDTLETWFTPVLQPIVGSVGLTGGNVTISNNVNVTISGPVTVAGTVNIGTMPAVVIDTTGGPVFVSIASSTTITVQGSVSITGNVDIGSMPAVTITSSSGAPVYVNLTNSVQIAAGTANIGTVNIAAGQSVTISAGSAIIGTVNLAAGTKISIGTVDTITAADATIQNDILPSNTLVFINHLQHIITSVVAGTPFNIADYNSTVVSGQSGTDPAPGLYDGVMLAIKSTNDYEYTLTSVDARLETINPTTAQNTASQAIGGSTAGGGGLGIYYSGPTLFSSVVGCSSFNLNLSTPATGGPYSDTIDVWFYAIRAQVQVNNPSSNPAQMQPSVGEFGATLAKDTTNLYGTIDSGTDVATLIASGTPKYIRVIHIQMTNNETANWVRVRLLFGSGPSAILGDYFLGPYAAVGCNVNDHILFPDGTAFTSDLRAAAYDAPTGVSINVDVSATIEGVANAAALVTTTH